MASSLSSPEAIARGITGAAGDEELKEGDHGSLVTALNGAVDGEGEIHLQDIPLSRTPPNSTSPNEGAAATLVGPRELPGQLESSSSPLQYRNFTLQAAAAKGDLAQVVLLWTIAAAAGINPMLQDAEGNNPMHYAALADTSEVASFLVQQTGGFLGPGLPLMKLRNADGETPLLRAAATGHLQTIKYLLEQGSDLASRDTGNGNTVFHNAARNGRIWALHFFLTLASKHASPKEIATLIHLPDSEDHTCLDWASFNGHLPVVQYLVRKGMSPTRTDRRGRNPLHLAARAGHERVCRYLVTKHHLSPYTKDADGKDACTYAGGDQAVLAALHASPSISSDASPDTIDTPTRANPVRPSFLFSYAFITTICWILPFFLAWYWTLPLVSLVLVGYRRLASVYQRANDQQQRQAAVIKPKVTYMAQWLCAHENYIGFWSGTLLAFLLTYPILLHWPHSMTWSTQAEVSREQLLSHPAVTSSFGTVISMYLLLLALIIVWSDLVFWRADPGVVRFQSEHYEKMLDDVVLKAAAPDGRHTCHTCLVRKPLRSKHCRDCGYCIARMDHHCVWLDGCVGVLNHGRFLLFVLLHLVSVSLFLACILPVLRLAIQSALPPHIKDASQVLRVLCLRPIFPLLLQCLFAVGTACGLLMLLQEQAMNVCRNITSNERINGARYAWITSAETGKYYNRFNRGLWRNLLEFSGLGNGKYKRDYFSIYTLPSETENLSPSPSHARVACCSADTVAPLPHRHTHQALATEKEPQQHQGKGEKSDKASVMRRDAVVVDSV